MKLISKRFSTQNNHKEFEAEVYQREENLIITHTSLKKICWNGLSDDERPKIHYEPVDLSKLPGVPFMFAIKCIMETKSTYIEQVGEMLCMTWEYSNQITKENPVSICMNRAFDKAFILFMQFKIPADGIRGIYSSEEIPLDNKSVLIKEFSSNGAVILEQPQAYEQSDIPQEQPSGEFPWNNSMAPQQQVQDNRTQNSIPPQQELHSNMNVNVRRVSWEAAFQKSKVETDMGIFLFDPNSGVWESQSMDMQNVDTRQLYIGASRWLGFELSNFRGFN